jgi:hydroxymethylbilane synthase
MPATTDGVLRIGTRGSTLAITQTGIVVDLLRDVRPGLRTEVVVIKTTGDRVTDRPYAEIGPKGVFAAELQHALLRGEVDVAIHSLKDLPADEPDGLVIAAVPVRADPCDVLVSRERLGLSALPPGSRVGTSSSRRVALLKIERADLEAVPLRGNVDTRLAKVARGDIDAALLAAAGLERLGRLDEATERLDPVEFPPAPGQGALAVEAVVDRVAGDLQWLHDVEHPATRAAIAAERAFLRAMEGGCDVPLGAYARVDGDVVELHGIVSAPDGSEHLRGSASGSDAEAVGLQLARELESRGARRIVDMARTESPG